MIRYSAQATDDLDNIEIYHTDRAGSRAAEGLMNRIIATLERLIVRNPGAGRRRPEFGSDVRSFPVLPYVIFYRAERNRVYVVRVLHGHRNIQRPLASLLLAM